jgi:alpha-D-xyloside xylohydrolase
MGADVYKTDFGEDVPADAVFNNGQTGVTLHNLYPLLYNKAIYEVVEQEKGYGLVWARSGFTGSQKYPVCWSGDPAADWDSLAATIRGGLTLAFSGIPFWSNDIGGYRGIPSPELYVRWVQFGLFCSHSRMHGDSPREPWFFGENALRIVRKYILLRYRLFPYIYCTAIESHRTGMPVIRPMPLLFPEDPNCHSLDLQYMFGPWLLVAPMYNDSDSRWIYLPKGKWIDFFNGKIFEGPANIRYKAPFSKLPLFVRSGAILPMMRKSFRIPKGRINPLIVEVFPAENTNYELWEDEGKTVFHCLKSEKEIILRITGKFARNYILHFRTIKNIKEARIETRGKLNLVDKVKIKNIRNGIELSLNRIKEAKIIFDTGV